MRCSPLVRATVLALLLLPACASPGEGGTGSAAAGFQRSRLGVTVWEAGRQLDEGRLADARRTLAALDDELLADGRVQLLLARLAIAEGRPGAASGHLARAGEALPGRAEVAVLRARLAESQGEWPAAEQAWAEAALGTRDDVLPVLGRARALLAQGRTGDALALLEREIAARPLSGELLRALGLVHFAAGRPAEAAAALQQALDLLADGPRTLLPLVLALSACGRHEQIVALREGFDLLALPEAGLAAVTHAALLAGPAELAVSAAQARVQRRPSDAAGWNDLARAHFVAARYGQAEEALLHAGSLAPLDAAGLTLLGHVRGRLLRVDEAMECYRQAVLAGADGTRLAPVMLALVEARARHDELLLAGGGAATAATAAGTSAATASPATAGATTAATTAMTSGANSFAAPAASAGTPATTAAGTPAATPGASSAGTPAATPGTSAAGSSATTSAAGAATSPTSAATPAALTAATALVFDLGPCALPPLPPPLSASDPSRVVAELLERWP